ncbi:MAG: hypothetical protein [Microvirus sp.]|nr:MAG: hypothetical protein [Microvirus sp.]
MRIDLTKVTTSVTLLNIVDSEMESGICLSFHDSEDAQCDIVMTSQQFINLSESVIIKIKEYEEKLAELNQNLDSIE